METWALNCIIFIIYISMPQAVFPSIAMAEVQRNICKCDGHTNVKTSQLYCCPAKCSSSPKNITFVLQNPASLSVNKPTIPKVVCHRVSRRPTDQKFFFYHGSQPCFLYSKFSFVLLYFLFYFFFVDTDSRFSSRTHSTFNPNCYCIPHWDVKEVSTVDQGYTVRIHYIYLCCQIS